jgi:hypothetical protein
MVRAVRGSTCIIITGTSEKFTFPKVSMQCPHVLLVKVVWKQVKALGIVQGGVLENVLVVMCLVL